MEGINKIRKRQHLEEYEIGKPHEVGEILRFLTKWLYRTADAY
jgi:hypothetical protein